MIRDFKTDFHFLFDHGYAVHEGEEGEQLIYFLWSKLSDIYAKAEASGYMKGYEEDVIFHRESYDKGRAEFAKELLEKLKTWRSTDLAAQRMLEDIRSFIETELK